jgi:riboflavin kinase/FMN adenylyltransferase
MPRNIYKGWNRRMGQITFSGTVVHGDGYGRRLGFPTANIDRRHWSRLAKKPRLGVYAGLVTVEHTGHTRQAAIVVGPLDRRGLPKLEAHILDFQGSVYGKKLTFQLVRYLRSFKKYHTEQELVEAISQDIKQVKNLTV